MRDSHSVFVFISTCSPKSVFRNQLGIYLRDRLRGRPLHGLDFQAQGDWLTDYRGDLIKAAMRAQPGSFRTNLPLDCSWCRQSNHKFPYEWMINPNIVKKPITVLVFLTRASLRRHARGASVKGPCPKSRSCSLKAAQVPKCISRVGSGTDGPRGAGRINFRAWHEARMPSGTIHGVGPAAV